MEMNWRAKMLSVIAGCPTLGRHGFGARPKEHAAFLATITHRDVLTFLVDRDWLGMCQRRKAINETMTSLGLSRIATNPVDDHGIFLAAVVHHGMPFRIDEQNPRVAHLAISSQRLPSTIELAAERRLLYRLLEDDDRTLKAA